MPFPPHQSQRPAPRDRARQPDTAPPPPADDFAALAYLLACWVVGNDLVWALDARLRVNKADRSVDGRKAARAAFAAVNGQLSLWQQLRVGTAVGVYETTEASPLPLLAFAGAVLFWIVYALVAIF